MNSIDINEQSKDMRPNLLDQRTTKLVKQLGHFNSTVSKCLKEKIRVLPYDWT